MDRRDCNGVAGCGSVAGGDDFDEIPSSEKPRLGSFESGCAVGRMGGDASV